MTLRGGTSDEKREGDFNQLFRNQYGRSLNEVDSLL
jgi:hypothetical protein